MTDDAAAKLLATVEELMAEVRALRKEAREDREARDLLANRKLADAERQASLRARRRSQNSNVTSRDSNVTREVVSSSDHSLKIITTKEPPASRDSNVTSRDTAPAWVSFSAAYEKRYGVKPVRNATTNAQMAQVLKRLGVEEAPGVAAFYVSSNESFFVQKRHPVGLLLQNCEGLRTQWSTGVRATATHARQQDQTQANADGVKRTLEELKADGLVRTGN